MTWSMEALASGVMGLEGKDVDDGLHQRLARRGFIGQAGGLHGRKDVHPLGRAGQHQGQHHGKSGGAHVIHDRLASHRAHPADVLHRDDTGGDGKQHDGHHDEFQQVQEDRAPRAECSFSRCPVRWAPSQGQATAMPTTSR